VGTRLTEPDEVVLLDGAASPLLLVGVPPMTLAGVADALLVDV